jgi:hypothetical protein
MEQRFRQSLATTDWREAQAKQKELIAAAEQGKLSASSGAFAKLLFEDAAEKYLAARLPELAESSQVKERQMLVKVTEYFRGRRLRDITAEDVLGFRQWRTTGGVGPAIINMETVARSGLRHVLQTRKPFSAPSCMREARCIPDKALAGRDCASGIAQSSRPCASRHEPPANQWHAAL